MPESAQDWPPWDHGALWGCTWTHWGRPVTGWYGTPRIMDIHRGSEHGLLYWWSWVLRGVLPRALPQGSPGPLNGERPLPGGTWPGLCLGQVQPTRQIQHGLHHLHGDHRGKPSLMVQVSCELVSIGIKAPKVLCRRHRQVVQPTLPTQMHARNAHSSASHLLEVARHLSHGLEPLLQVDQQVPSEPSPAKWETNAIINITRSLGPKQRVRWKIVYVERVLAAATDGVGHRQGGVVLQEPVQGQGQLAKIRP